jgi:hypothetical protein
MFLTNSVDPDPSQTSGATRIGTRTGTRTGTFSAVCSSDPNSTTDDDPSRASDDTPTRPSALKLLGSVHGVGGMFASIARTVGPAFAGALWARLDVVFVFWGIAGVLVVEGVMSFVSL